MEPIQHANSKNFAATIMKIQLRYGFCHTIVLNRDSKFYGVCHEALDLLHINYHVLSGDNHNPMMVDRVNGYLTKGLKIMTNKHDSVCVALEAILLLLYAWNTCPIPGTDISHSLVALAMNLPYQSITQPISIGNKHLPPSAWSHILEISSHASLHFARSPTYLSKNTVLTIVCVCPSCCLI